MKRVSSRDDLFLSVVDLYTLLSMLFIGMAFMVTSTAGIGGVDLTALPEAPPNVEPSTANPTIVSWDEPSTESPSLDQMCFIKVEGPRATRLQVPCWPQAFRRDRSALPQAPWTPHRVLIVCPKPRTSEDSAARSALLACARLQWVVAEHGGAPVALVRERAPVDRR